MELVVAGHGDEAAPGHAHGVEDLDGGVAPHLEVGQLLPVGDEVEADALHGSRQRQAADQQDDQHQVGEGGRHVHHLHSASSKG